MLATVLDSELAIERAIQIIREFSSLEIQMATSPQKLSDPIVEVLKDLKKTVEDGQIAGKQMITILQEVNKISERMNILETRMEAVIKTKGSFNENHWLFGKFTELIAEGIDQNRGEIDNINVKIEKLMQQKTKTSSKK